MTWILYAALAAAIVTAVPLAWWLRVEGDRAWREHRIREATEPIRRGFVQLQIEIRDSLTPALQRAAEAASRLFEELGTPTPRNRAVTAELVRLTLGGRPDRPELRTDVPGEGAR